MRTPCTLEAWKKDKCQKVKTRNGLTPLHMRDMSYQGKTVIIYDIDDEVHICGTDGKVNPDSDSDFDLFIVKEKKVLSETEKKSQKRSSENRKGARPQGENKGKYPYLKPYGDLARNHSRDRGDG